MSQTVLRRAHVKLWYFGRVIPQMVGNVILRCAITWNQPVTHLLVVPVSGVATVSLSRVHELTSRGLIHG